MVSLDNEQIVSQSLSTTFWSDLKTSFLKPCFLISFHICSIGFISGVYGGIKTSSIFSGILNEPDLCQAAPSHAYGITTKQLSPVSGSTAPYTYLYSLIWWQGTDGLIPFSHQQYFGLFILPKPASSWNISRTLSYLLQFKSLKPLSAFALIYIIFYRLCL